MIDSGGDQALLGDEEWWSTTAQVPIATRPLYWCNDVCCSSYPAATLPRPSRWTGMWRVRAGGAADSFHHPGTALETQAAIKGALGQLGVVQGELLSMG